MTEHKAGRSITKNEKYKKLKHDGAQNRHEHYYNRQIEKG